MVLPYLTATGTAGFNSDLRNWRFSRFRIFVVICNLIDEPIPAAVCVIGAAVDFDQVVVDRDGTGAQK